MTFVSLTFLVFAPVVFALYWITGRRLLQNFLLILASYLFYGWWDYRFCGLMLVSSLVDYGLGLAMGSIANQRGRRWLLGLSLLTNLSLLATFCQPPPTTEFSPLAVLSQPPPTTEYSPLATF